MVLKGHDSGSPLLLIGPPFRGVEAVTEFVVRLLRLGMHLFLKHVVLLLRLHRDLREVGGLLLLLLLLSAQADHLQRIDLRLWLPLVVAAVVLVDLQLDLWLHWSRQVRWILLVLLSVFLEELFSLHLVLDVLSELALVLGLGLPHFDQLFLDFELGHVPLLLSGSRHLRLQHETRWGTDGSMVTGRFHQRLVRRFFF